MYSYLYSFVQKLILKKSLNLNTANLLKILKIKITQLQYILSN